MTKKPFHAMSDDHDELSTEIFKTLKDVYPEPLTDLVNSDFVKVLTGAQDVSNPNKLQSKTDKNAVILDELWLPDANERIADAIETVALIKKYYGPEHSISTMLEPLKPEEPPEEFNEEWAQIEAENYDDETKDAFIAGARWMFEQLRKK